MPANDNGKNLAAVAAELKDEFKEFASTRLAMLQSEMRDKVSGWKAAAPMMVIGAVLLGTAWLLLTGAIVAALYVAFADNPWAAALALIIVCVAYAIFGGITLMVAVGKVKDAGVVPERTLRVLKDDQVWISNEARAQL